MVFFYEYIKICGFLSRQSRKKEIIPIAFAKKTCYNENIVYNKECFAMKATERMSNFFKGKEIDRLPMLEWAPIWDLTHQRWMKEGLNIPFTYFARDWRKVQLELGLDANFQTYFPARTPGVCPVATTHGAGLAKNEAEYEKLKQYKKQE